ncbi:polysaccharide pyruvyl transferase family protein [Corynebacterium comes]|uniref:Polysaccharide pyruvyl transferase n=1 Tax=Corynebacterium comes TaxID=2675218 RepID=A0A6B8VYA0_9CORY|nr:polysaccharide pyruvyl transferase family protein [Corynebacterium comes]QGU05141.1 Polysaccharide pyruvyl transferase [Corynebacterium comes]
MGDFIINESIMREMGYLFNENFVIRYGTHNPLLHHFQMIKPNAVNKTCREANFKFLGGTNLLKRNLMRPILDWNVDLVTSALYKGSVALGCGIAGIDNGKTNTYTKRAYDRALSKNYVHSVRDEASKRFLERLGFEACNTGCPTLWGFTDGLNESIPKTKSEHVVFTLTDYAPDLKQDQKLINILNRNYKEVYFWVQGSEDFKYLEQFSGIENVKIINPSLSSYKEILVKGGIDYVGTRLHAGIYAMQHSVRSVILAVDNRARDMDESHHLNVIEREDVDSLPSLLNSSITTSIFVDHELVNSWKGQFKSL